MQIFVIILLIIANISTIIIPMYEVATFWDHYHAVLILKMLIVSKKAEIYNDI